jgi:hypothetical protein
MVLIGRRLLLAALSRRATEAELSVASPKPGDEVIQG